MEKNKIETENVNKWLKNILADNISNLDELCMSKISQW